MGLILQGVCEQQRHRPAWASAQSDQPLSYSLKESNISKLATSEILIFWLVSVAEETVLSLASLETPKAGFVVPQPIWCSISTMCTLLLNSLPTGQFCMLFGRLLIFFKINFFKKFFQESITIRVSNSLAPDQA